MWKKAWNKQYVLQNAYLVAKIGFDTAENEPSKNRKNMKNFVNFAAWTSGRSGILDTISDMKEKAESTLSDARAAEMKAGHESSPLSGLSPVLRVRHASAFSIQLSWRAAAGAGSLCGKEEEEIRSLLQGLPEVRHVEAKSGDADLDHEEAHVGGHHGEVRLSSHFKSQDFGI